MKYLIICAVWIACYVAPQYAGGWFDLQYNLLQSGISLFLLFFVLHLSHEEWSREYGCVCVIQVIFNAGDFIFDLPPDHYNHILDILNFIEAAILFGWGGLTQLRRTLGYGQSAPNHRDSGTRRVQTSPRIQGGKGGL